MLQTTRKLCARCEGHLPLTDFPRNKWKSDGLSIYCRACVRLFYLERRANDKDYSLKRNAQIRARRINKNEALLAKDRRDKKRYRALYPEKQRAKGVLRNAVSIGFLVRPKQCPACKIDDPRGIDGRTLIQAHHNDYSKPLEVQWLCVHCHAAMHRSQANPKAEEDGKG